MPTVELFGSVKLLAGVSQVEVQATTVREALMALAQRLPQLLGPVLDAHGTLRSAYAINVNGERFVRSLDEQISPSDQVLVVSNTSGG